jgi:hypothetical protein
LAKLLFLNPEADVAAGQLSGSHWELPDDTDVDSLRAKLEQAISGRTALSFPVLLPGGGGREAQLTLNAAALLSASLLEVKPPPTLPGP